jgi:hypothetical protein
MRGLAGIFQSTGFGAALSLVLATAFRLPELLNPGVVNSDSAIVGLQAMHGLNGEWQWFLWGSGYQTTADPAVAAVLFAIFGPTSIMLLLTALLGHLLATLFAYLTLKRHFSPWVALLLVAPLIASSAPTHTYTLHPPRQTALTLVFLAIWCLDGAARSRRPSLRMTIGAGVAALSWFADPYALVFGPGLAFLIVFCAFDVTDSRGYKWRSLLAAAIGGAVGALPFLLGRLQREAVSGPLSFSRDLVTRNWTLLWDSCLPWVLGTRVLHQPVGASGYVVWKPPSSFLVIQWLGASSLAIAVLLALLWVFEKRMDWAPRRLGVSSAVVVVTSLAGFLLSVMPMDHFASRYLVSLVLVAPFLFAVVARRVRPWVLGAIMAPMLVSFAVCGWLGYEPLVDGLRVVDARLEHDEEQLLRELQKRGIKVAMADYWAAYRLTFLFKEAVIVIPMHESQDRYSPYRRRFSAAARFAYIYDHKRSEESQQTVDTHVADGLEEKFSVGNFDAYVVRRDNSSRVASTQLLSTSTFELSRLQERVGFPSTDR